MNQLVIQVRKDLKLLSTDAMFILLIVGLSIIAFLTSLMVCTSYVSSARQADIATAGSIIMAQKLSLGQYWGALMTIDSAVFVVAGSLAMGAEKDGGMLRYILTSECDKKRFFASKLIVLMIMVAIAVLVSTISFVISFTLMDMPTLGIDLILASTAFPALILLVFASLGLLMSSLSKKKTLAIILAVFLLLFLTSISSISNSVGTSEAYKANHYITVNNVTDYIPILYKVIDLSNPTILSQGTYLTLGLVPEDFAAVNNPVFFDIWGGIALGLGMLALFTILGYLAFRAERLDRSGDNRGMIGRILGK